MERPSLITANKVRALKGLVFDLDDTLYLQADYKRSGFKAVAQWLSKHVELDADQTYDQLEKILLQQGPSHPKIFDEFVARQKLSPELVPQLVDAFIKHQPQVECFRGVQRMLTTLRKRYFLGLLTDGRLLSQQKKVHALKLENYFDAILFSDQLGMSKPAVELYRWFELKFSIPGSQLAYIGDNPLKDFLGANHCGWLTIRVLSGEYAKLEVHDARQADIGLPKVTDLKKTLLENANCIT